MTRSVIASLLFVACVGCGAEQPAGPAQSPSPPSGEVDGGIPESSDICEEIAAQRALNEKLAAGGYADDYTSQYDAMADAEDCPAS